MTLNSSRARIASAPIAAHAVVLVVVWLVYWPVRNAGFVWDDKPCIHDAAWLRYGSEWMHYVLRDFCGWSSYFRPLGVALLTLQARLFDAQPGPMHLVSLGLHLANVFLIGLISRSLAKNAGGGWRTTIVPPAAMLIYGLHPVLVEPVVWINCQFDLLSTLFFLLALLANAVSVAWSRALLVGSCFFLSAAAKESAFALPLVIVLFDVASKLGADGSWISRLSAVWRQQFSVYLALAAAGLLYLATRYWALGDLVAPGSNETLPLFTRFQEFCATFIAYMRLIAWPMTSLGPIHVADAGTFAALTASSLASDIAALAILAAGAVLALRRIFAGIALLTVAAALLPVLHLLPFGFGDSLYHERYAMNALAVAIILAPRALFGVQAQARERGGSPSRRGLAAAAALGLWLFLAIINVRATVPLWSNDVLLWEWALARNPDSVEAKDHLLTAYMVDNDVSRARELAASIVSSGTRCPSCLLNAASLALDEQDAARAEEILETLKHDEVFGYDAELFHKYILVVGRLLESKGDLAGAESAYREAMRMQPLDPKSRSLLAWTLLREGNVEQARDMMQMALERFAPDVRARYRFEFERQVAAARKSAR